MPRLVLFAALLLATGCADSVQNDVGLAEDVLSDPSFGVTDSYVRAAPSGGVSAVFLTIENPSAVSDTLLSAATDVSDDVAIHQTTTGEDGMTEMGSVERIPIPAGATVSLEPGGYHLMLLDLHRALVPGDSLLVELTFAERGTITPRVPVRAIGSSE